MNKQTLALSSRVFAAIIGGYVLAHLIAIVASDLLTDSQVPKSQASGVMVGMQLSYLIYAAVVMWVFAVKKLQKVWLGLLLSCSICGVLIFVLKGLS